VKTYYLTSKFKILYVAISILLILVLVLIFKTSFPYICLGIYSILILLFTFKNITDEHVELSINGIEYHKFGLTLNVKWENIEKINEYWSIPFRQEGLCIDPDQIRITEWWLGSYTSHSGWSRKVFIPLSTFADNWRDSELGQQIKQYAPHLFEKEKSA
jgi:hypothetical protein